MTKSFIIDTLNQLWFIVTKNPNYFPLFKINEKKEITFNQEISKSERKWWNKRGFLSEKELMYDKSKVHLYVSDIEMMFLGERLNMIYKTVSNDKFVFYRFLNPIANVIPIKMYISNVGQISFIEPDITNEQEFITSLKNNAKYLIKPIDGGGGKGVETICYDNKNKMISIDNNLYSKKDLFSYIKSFRRAIIQPFIESSGYAKKVFPGCLNTLRVITMINPETNRPFIAAVAHKFATSNNRIADNWKQNGEGGLLCYVDKQTGIIGNGYLYPKNKNTFIPLDKHPDTNEYFKNIQIPNWHLFTEQMIDLASKLDILKFIGWDVSWDGQNILVIEANYNPDTTLNQIFMPFLLDNEVKKFYMHYKKLLYDLSRWK